MKHEHGPAYPVNLGAKVKDFRALARVSKPSREEAREHGDAVGIAIRALQRRELMACWPRMPSLERPPIKRSRSPLTVPYSRPNPFPMVGDPSERDAKSLYAHAMAHRT
jgi:hypothetical protein